MDEARAALLLNRVFVFVFLRSADWRRPRYTRLHPESALEPVGANDVSPLSGFLPGCGVISANPAGTPRFDSRRKTRVTRFHAMTAARVIDPFLARFRSALGQGDLKNAR